MVAEQLDHVITLPMLDTDRSEVIKGPCQSEKIQKSEKNSDWPDPTHPTPYPIFYFFGNMYSKKQHQNTHNF